MSNSVTKAAVSVVLLAAATPLPASGQDGTEGPVRFTVEEKARMIATAIARRQSYLGGVKIDACSLYLTLNRQQGFRQMVGANVRQALVGEVTEDCSRGNTPTSVLDYQPWMAIDTIEPRGPDRAVLTASVFPSPHRQHNEDYMLSRPDGEHWGVGTIKVYFFMTQH